MDPHFRLILIYLCLIFPVLFLGSEAGSVVKTFLYKIPTCSKPSPQAKKRFSSLLLMLFGLIKFESAMNLKLYGHALFLVKFPGDNLQIKSRIQKCSKRAIAGIFLCRNWIKKCKKEQLLRYSLGEIRRIHHIFIYPPIHPKHEK